MCARYTLTKEGLVITIGEVEVVIKVGARYNIAPTQKVPVIAPTDKGIELVEMIWGWKVPWTKAPLINAQAETITVKTTFKNNLDKRCLVPADGFYEWTPDKTPIRFTKPNDAVFCFAGLWQEEITQELDVPVTNLRVILLTTTPNKSVGRIHNRMPLIVRREDYTHWLGESMASNVLQNPDRDELESCPLQRAVNSVRNEGPDLIRPALPPK